LGKLENGGAGLDKAPTPSCLRLRLLRTRSISRLLVTTVFLDILKDASPFQIKSVSSEENAILAINFSEIRKHKI
jgi:hypothetical protein